MSKSNSKPKPASKWRIINRQGETISTHDCTKAEARELCDKQSAATPQQAPCRFEKVG
jgi:hypothetical protein